MRTPFPSSPPDPAGAPGLLTRWVWVISSDPVIAELLFWMLSLAGYPTRRMTMEEALFHAGSQARRFPALVLLDVAGPHEAGLWDRLHPVRVCWPVPWLLLTNGPDCAPRATGGVAVLGKPFHLRDLLQRVHQVLAPDPLDSFFAPTTASFQLGPFPASLHMMRKRNMHDPSTNSYVFDPNEPAEMARLLHLDQMTTRAMGGPLTGLPEVPEQGKVLDLACGPGGWVLDVAFARPDCEVAGVDISQTMIECMPAPARAAST